MADIDKYIFPELQNKYEFFSYGHAIEILTESFPDEWRDICSCLSQLRITKSELMAAGGNETAIPKNLTIFYTRWAGEKSGSRAICW